MLSEITAVNLTFDGLQSAMVDHATFMTLKKALFQRTHLWAMSWDTMIKSQYYRRFPWCPDVCHEWHLKASVPTANRSAETTYCSIHTLPSALQIE